LAIDSLREEWAAKPVGFVSYGGIGGGLRAVEQLRLVFAELHAVTVRDTVSFHNANSLIDPGGHITDPQTATGAASAMDVLLNRLIWWGTTLREARKGSPYFLAA
jgi:NAD(P)H-dependent FMN reductase